MHMESGYMAKVCQCETPKMRYNLESSPAHERSPGQCDPGHTCRIASHICLLFGVSFSS